MRISLKARNAPKLLVVWLVNVVLFIGIVSGVLDITHPEALYSTAVKLTENPWSGLPYAVLLTVVSIFNGVIPRPVKERIVFWRKPRPGARAFSQFIYQDSTIDRKAIEEEFSPLPTVPDEQNALWAKWLNEFDDDPRVRPVYGWYLFGRDWALIAVASILLGCPFVLAGNADSINTIGYCVLMVCQYLLARQFARIQGEQLVMSVLSCKGSSLGPSTVKK